MESVTGNRLTPQEVEHLIEGAREAIGYSSDWLEPEAMAKAEAVLEDASRSHDVATWILEAEPHPMQLVEWLSGEFDKLGPKGIELDYWPGGPEAPEEISERLRLEFGSALAEAQGIADYESLRSSPGADQAQGQSVELDDEEDYSFSF